MLAIPKDGAQNADKPHTFITTFWRPEGGSSRLPTMWPTPPQRAADELVDPEVLADPGYLPHDEVHGQLFVAEPRPLANQRIVTRPGTGIIKASNASGATR